MLLSNDIEELWMEKTNPTALLASNTDIQVIMQNCPVLLQCLLQDPPYSAKNYL